MYKKLEYFNDFSERTPEEKRRGTLTPPPGGSHGSDAEEATTGTGDANGHNDHNTGGSISDGSLFDEFAPSGHTEKKDQEDYSKYLNGWDQPTAWDPSAYTFLEGAEPAKLGEDS